MTTTDMISLYIPPRRPINEVIGALKGELNIAEGIKSDETKKSVQFSIDNIIDYLQQLTELPANGMAIFAHRGVINAIRPVEPIKINLYRCDDHYDLEHLNEA